MKRYNPTDIEPKWQQIWADDQRYVSPDVSAKPTYYVTGMFPYPSGAGMHAGHFMEHSIVDSVARFRRALGYNVLYPMGWDSFGLPAENYAIKTGKKPQDTTRENIANFKHQLKRVGASIDWSRELNTADPEYYKWTQWMFTQLFERGLAYQKEANQWWCPKDKTVLANEQVVGGRCWRCEELVVKKPMKQWFFKITDYADALLEEIPALNWPDKIKTAQTNWIGRSEGATILFDIDKNEVSRGNVKGMIEVFSTRPDTIFGATFLVLAPEHPLVKDLVNDDTREAVSAYCNAAIKRSEIERASEGKEKTGVFTGSYAINPATGERIPIWVADYVLWGYGTGAIMAVPAHDERDYEFANAFDLPIIQVVADYEEWHDGVSALRNDVEQIKRPAINAIICNTKGEYLLEIESDNHVHFVGGGIDPEDNSVEEAIRREVREETGYTNIISIRQVTPYTSVNGYRHTKNKNQMTWGAFYEVVVDDSVQVESEIEGGRHTIVWLGKTEVEAKISPNWKHHSAAWRHYLAEASVFTLNTCEGTMVNSGQFDGMASSEAREQIVAWLEQENRGRAKVTYKMRDWLISRQRYWGAPIPIIHCEKDGAVAVPADQLPVLLPDVDDFAPKGDGKSPLARETDWVNTTCPTCGGPATRETDVMDGYACSSWYLLRYTDPHNAEAAFAPDKVNTWAPLDMYVGGDHAVAHLLYVRFWTHVFRDMGLTDFAEPVQQLVYHGLIQAEDGRKMSKSLGNTVDPLEVIDAGYGADALRTFELFLGPIDENSNWSSRGIAGVYRFLNRAWALVQEYMEWSTQIAGDDVRGSTRNSSQDAKISEADASAVLAPSDLRSDAVGKAYDGSGKVLQHLTHATIKKVTDDIYRLSFNTAIAAQMEFVNELYKLKLSGFNDDWRFTIESLVKLVQPFAPHMAAELWQQLGHDSQLDTEPWPVWDEAYLVADTMTIIVQVNGKLRAKLEVAQSASEADIKAAALADANVQKFVSGEPRKVIYVPRKLVSIVA